MCVCVCVCVCIHDTMHIISNCVVQQTLAMAIYFQSSENLVDEELDMVITERLCVDDLMQVRAHQLSHQIARRERE